MIIIYVLTILNAITCLATSIDSNPARKFTLDNVKMLVKAFMTYRDTPGSLEFAAAMGDPERLKLAGATRRDNYLPLYLSLNSDLFDTVRKMYKVCNMEGLELQKSMISPALKSVYQSVDILGLCLPYTPDFEETEMGLVNILNEIGRRKGIIDANGRLNDSVHIMSCFLDRYLVDSSWSFQNKKYLWAMIRFDLLTNNPEGRAKLIESFGHKLSLQNLIELNAFARKHGIENTLFDIDELIYKEGKDNSTTTTSNASISSTDNSSGSEYQNLGEVFNYDGIREEILELLNWRTLWYTMPYVNKLLSMTVSRKFVIQRCDSLKEYLKTKAKEYDPEYLFNVVHPWNSLFPTVHHLVKFYVGNFYEADIPDSWLRKIYEGVIEFDYDDSTLTKSLEANRKNLILSIDYPIECLVRLTNIILKNLTAYKDSVFYSFKGKLMIDLLSKVDQPVLLFQHIREQTLRSRHDYAISSLLNPILVADKLDWPEELRTLAEETISNFCGFTVKLPFTAEQIQKLAPEQLHMLVYTFHFADNTSLENKIFDALSECDLKMFEAFTAYNFARILSVLTSFPFAMNEQQFERYVRLAIQLKGDDAILQHGLLLLAGSYDESA